MAERRLDRRGRRAWTLFVTLAAVGLFLGPGLLPPARAAYPVLPDSEWSPLLGQLVGPTLSPGGTGAVSFQLGDPLAVALHSVSLSLLVYAFNPSDGGAPQAAPVGSSPTLGGGSAGTNLSLAALAPGATWSASVPVSVPTTAPTGDYAVRFAMSFTSGNYSYRLESRGFFSPAAWAAATQLANGTPTINASQLAVSGVVPETSILVSSGAISWALYAVLGVGIGLAGVGAYWWSRSAGKSNSGAR